MKISFAAILVLMMAVGTAQQADSKPHPDLPDDYQQLLPRGRIAAVSNPEFVTAEEAELDGEAWVLGVVIEGQAKAYSLNLLNHHEVVNDSAGGRKFAAVW